MPSTLGAIDLGPQLIEWGGAQRWLRAPADADTAHAIRRTVAAVGGYATPLAPALLGIHKRLRESFDPHGVFVPGRPMRF